jgi:hypothetical protein
MEKTMLTTLELFAVVLLALAACVVVLRDAAGR